jgi:tRNA/rRNA methyltransferase
MASGADRILDEAVLYDTLPEAVADCSLVLATTARAHDQAKPVIDAGGAAREAAARIAAAETVGILFGRERIGLENHEVALADRIVTLPVNPAFASLNLGQAVVVVAYEWFKLTGSGLPFVEPEKSPPASKQQLLAFFNSLEQELEKVEFFRPPDKRDTMQINLRNIFTRMALTQQDIRTLHGVIMSIADGRKGPARGGLLTATRRRCSARYSPSMARAGCRTSAGRCAGWRGFSAATRPKPSGSSGTHSCATAASSARVSSGRSRSVRTSPTWCRSRSAWRSSSFPPARPRRLPPRALGGGPISPSAGYRVVDVAIGEVEADVSKALDRFAAAVTGVGRLAPSVS